MKPDEPVRGIRMLRVSEISARTSLSRSQLYELLNRRVLPPLVHIGPRARGLPEHVLDDWLQSRTAQRPTTVPVPHRSTAASCALGALLTDCSVAPASVCGIGGGRHG